jgi:hypothetical protein
MGKLPAYLHWAKDWLTDVDLSMCSKAAKGVWIDVLDTMFLNCIRGVACNEDGKPWSDEDLARAIGGDITENVTRIRELLARGVARRNANGAIYSRRMVADEKERQSNKERQKKHRNGESNADVTPNITGLSGTGNGKAFDSGSKEKKELTEFDVHQATSFVFLEIGLAGNEARMLAQDAVNSFIHNNKASPQVAAHELVKRWNQYDKTDLDFKRGVLKFFKEGLWNKPEAWEKKAKKPFESAADKVRKQMAGN